MDEQLEVVLKGGEFRHLIESQFGEIRKKYGLKKVDIEVLYFLSKCKEANTPTDIYRRLSLNRGHVSQAIDFLSRRGLIAPIPDKDDRRYMHYSISQDAEDIINEIAKIRQNLDKQVFKGITSEELLAYKETSKKIFRNIMQSLN